MLTRLGSKRSAWNAADIRGEVEQTVASSGVVAAPAVRRELAEDLTARAVEAAPRSWPATMSPNTSDPSPHHRSSRSRSASPPAHHSRPAAGSPRADGRRRFDDAQIAVLTAMTGDAQLLVVEGAAGAGKTNTLAAARVPPRTRRRRLVVVTPTLKAAQVAARELGTRAFSAAWLVHQHGFRWDDDGRWTREPVAPPSAATLRRGDVLLVDEAGMLDQDTALALLTIADERTRPSRADRRPPPAPRGRPRGRARPRHRAPQPDARLTLDVVHRFEDPEYADLSLLMRTW